MTQINNSTAGTFDFFNISLSDSQSDDSTTRNECFHGDLGSESDSGLGMDDWDWGRDLTDHPDHQADSGLHTESSVHSDRASNLYDDLSLDFLDTEDSDWRTQDISKTSVLKALRDLPKPLQNDGARRAKTAKKRLNVVDWKDWEDPVEQKLVRLMHLRAKAILTHQPEAPAYLKWFLANDPEEGLPFEKCSLYLGVDPNAVRLKLHSYLYLYWIVLSAPVSFFSTPIPSEVLSKAMHYGGPQAEPIAREIWNQPGIPQDLLIPRCIQKQDSSVVKYSEKQYISSLQHLLESRVILEQVANLYVVGHYGFLFEKRGH